MPVIVSHCHAGNLHLESDYLPLHEDTVDGALFSHFLSRVQVLGELVPGQVCACPGALCVYDVPAGL